MYSEYSLIVLLCIGGMILLAGLSPVDCDWSKIEDEEFQESDFEETEESLTATQAKSGAAATSAM